ncbi:rho GTPase-activating protein 19 [Osmerus mordax]|uniref:rho GTPase-activating protein 19 n=1 Tax=Osmerus mordax TaxID=8014 RepID=UPI00350FF07B
MAADKEMDESTQNRRGTVCNVVVSQQEARGSRSASRTPVIFNPDFFVEKLRHEKPDVFLELVLSNVTRLIDLPGAEFSLLLGGEGPTTPTSAGTGSAGGFFRSLNFLKRKDKGLVFGSPLTESSIAQVYQLIQYLSQNLHVEGLFRVPGNSVRQQALREQLDGGAELDLASGDFHPNDVATLLKSFLGELPEPLLTHRHFHAHLKIADMTLFDEQGNKTSVPDKERQMEALQLLLLLLPPASRTLLRLLLDLLYHTARQQDRNKMSAHNLALMFAPHVLWPRHMMASDLQENLKKLNSGMAFLIKHSQKLFRAPVYIRDHARMLFTGSTVLQTKDDLDLLVLSGSPVRLGLPLKRPAGLLSGSDQPVQKQHSSPTHDHNQNCTPPQNLHHTEEALKDLFRHVHDNMPDSAKKKKLIRQLAKQTTPGTPTGHHQTPPGPGKKHPRSRSFGGLIKRRVRGDQPTAERKLRHVSPVTVVSAMGKFGKENVVLQSVNSPLRSAPPLPGKSCDLASNRKKVLRGSKMVTSPAQEAL